VAQSLDQRISGAGARPFPVATPEALSRSLRAPLFLGVPSGYVSDSPLSETSTYLSQTFSSLGVTPGTYKWTWGSGANQNFTLVVESAVPEPSTWAMLLLGFAGLGYAGYRKTRCDNALA
jgi:hypothetical protein